MSDPSTPPLGIVLDLLVDQLQAEELFVINHDFTQLVPVGGGGRVAISRDMLKLFSDGKPSPASEGLLVPYLDHDDPVLVVRQPFSAVVNSPAVIGAFFGEVQRRYEQLEQLRRTASMTAAGQLQWDKLPRRTLQTSHLRAAGTLAPAYDVAGDLFDLAVQPDGTVAATALDAMGHGVTAALSAVLALAAIRAARRSGAPIDQQFQAADEALANEFGGDRFVTGVNVCVGPDMLEVVNAGHEPLLRFRGPQPQAISVPAQTPLGVEGPTEYRRVVLDPLQPGDMLALLSDGVSGATSAAGARFGTNAADQLVGELVGASPLALAHTLAHAITSHTGGDLGDDVTAVFLQARFA